MPIWTRVDTIVRMIGYGNYTDGCVGDGGCVRQLTLSCELQMGSATSETKKTRALQ